MNTNRHRETIEVVATDQRRRRWSVAEKSALVRELLVARRPQREPVAHAGGQLVGPGDDVEQQREVTGGARHRPDDGEVDFVRQWRPPGGVWPRLGTRPSDGFNAVTPRKCAGTRSEPPISEPSDSGLNPAANAAADPPDDPPGVRSRSHGLRVTP